MSLYYIHMKQKHKIYIFILISMLVLFLFYNPSKVEGFTPSKKKIAFCFLIYDEINQEELWKHFFKNVDSNKYNIYIHYKDNKPLKYFEQYKIKNSIPTKGFDMCLVRAQNILLEHALQDPNNRHIIFIYNSCIPLKNFNYIYSFLNPKYSYFNLFNQAFKKRWEKDTNIPIHIDYIQKASQWCILNRKHASLVLQYKDYEKWFSKLSDITYTERMSRGAPDEYSYISTLYYHNLHNELKITHNKADGATTFTNWYSMKYKYPMKQEVNFLKNYNYIDTDELNYLLQSSSLFGRKFKKDAYKSIIHNNRYIQTIQTI